MTSSRAWSIWGWRGGMGEIVGEWWRKRERERRERDRKKGGDNHKLPGPVSCYRVTDVLLTSAVAFYTLNTDLDRYTYARTLREADDVQSHVRTHINEWLNRDTSREEHTNYFTRGFKALSERDHKDSQEIKENLSRFSRHELLTFKK